MNSEPMVTGERTIASAASGRSIALRLQRVLAIGLVSSIGVGVLVWYYVNLGTSARAPATAAATTARSVAASEMKLPALVRPAARPSAAAAPPAAEPGALSPLSANGATRNVDDPPAAQGRAAPGGARSDSVRSSSPVLMRTSAPTVQASPSGLADLATLARAAIGADSAVQLTSPVPSVPTAPGIAAPLAATMLPTRRWLLPKGTALDCTLETAIDSTLAGLTTCMLATDVFGADGRVVLLERGTKLVGEARSEVRAGQARVAVLWNEARTPTGVAVAIGSLGTDALGRAGVPGATDTHFTARFGAAIMLSLIDGAISEVAARRSGTGLLVYGTQGTHEVATEALRNTINVPPTIRVAAGARVQVLVVRDLDFRRVYRLAERGEP